MRICILVSEVFAWGSYGGYGTIARSLAEHLSEAGHQVSALVPRRTDEAKRTQQDVENLGSLTVYALPHSYTRRVRQMSRYRESGAEVFVSVDPRFDSWMAMRANPESAHVIWFIDPMNFNDYWRNHVDRAEHANTIERLKSQAIFGGLRAFGYMAVKRADALAAQRQDFGPIRRFPGVGQRQVLSAPNPVEIPDGPIQKKESPQVLFLGRLDRQKNPGRFIELARSIPEVRFVMAGAASDPGLDARIRNSARDVSNLEMPGVVTGEEKNRLLSESWILCNTSLREGLPRSFQEALAYGCAIVSSNDPDSLVSRFGSVVEGEYEDAVLDLVGSGGWRSLGEQGRAFIRSRNAPAQAVQRHLEVYEQALSNQRS